LAFPEGSGDLDLRFTHEDEALRVHIQVKDHKVTNSELRAVVENFVSVNRDMPGVYARFTLACESLAPDIKTLATTLERYRRAEEFYDDAPDALATTLAHVKRNIARVGLEGSEDFIIEKVYFEDGLASFDNDEVTFNMFAARLQRLEGYDRVPLKDLERVYERLLRLIADSNTKTLNREVIQRSIKDSLGERPPIKPKPPAPPPLPPRDLSNFVNREGEVNAFCKMLKDAERPIMLVSGREGAGKTELVFKLLERCANLSVRNTAVIWADGRFNDYVEVMCKISEEIGSEFFEYFIALIEEEQSNPRIKLPGGQVTALSGPVEQPLRDFARARMALLTDAFVPGLAEATREEPVVIFLDYAEQMSEETRDWVWGELFRATADGKLPNVRFVLCTEQEPALKPNLITKIKKFSLKAFEFPHIVDFLERRFEKEKVAVNKDRLRGWAEMIYLKTDRYPASVLVAAVELVDLVQQQES
jgi:hypothetical protein